MWGRAPRIRRNGASSITVSTVWKTSGGNSSMGRTSCSPALFTSTSVPAAAASAASRSVRSTTCGSTAPPSPRTASASDSSPAASRSTALTLAPAAASRSAQARPIPPAAPVTRAVRPPRSSGEAWGAGTAREAVMSPTLGSTRTPPHVVSPYTSADFHRVEPCGGVRQRLLDPEPRELVHLRQGVHREPGDVQRLVVVDPRLAADGPAAEGDVHVLADVAVAVGHRLERLHQHHPLRHAAHRRLLLDLPHGAGGRLLPRLPDAPDHGPRAGVGPAVQQHSVLVVED